VDQPAIHGSDAHQGWSSNLPKILLDAPAQLSYCYMTVKDSHDISD
jgi:hypothetical protein